MEKLISSISGIRGIFGKTLTPQEIIDHTLAFSNFIKNKKIVIGRDGRITGNIISNIISSVLNFAGVDVIDLGIVPTPTVQMAVEYFNTGGGIAITASHNPIEWNGMKFISQNGMFLDHDQYKEFCDILNNLKYTFKDWNSTGSYKENFDFQKIHIQKVLELKFLQLDGIKKKKFKVVIDCVNASGSIIVPDLLEQFGCEVIKLNCELNGIFSHTPEPLPQNLIELSETVKKTKSDFGIAVDPDADRLVIICEDGTPFGEEYTITQAVRFILSKNFGKAVINISTTKAVDDVVNSFSGCELFKTPVGEINVAKKMYEIGAIIGGEGSGGIILPELHFGRDSLAGIAIFIQNITEFDGTVSEMRKSLPSYFMYKDKINLNNLEEAQKIIDHLPSKFKNEKISTMDGVRIDFEDSWVIIRKSNTEPIIRIYSEAKSMEEAKDLALKIKDKII